MHCFLSLKFWVCCSQITWPLSFQLAFEVTYPDIAGNEAVLDDIKLNPEPCPSSTLSCDFEQGLCGWSNDSPLLLTWLVGRGFTTNSSLVSGPFSDHTTQSGLYAYIDFTNSYPGKYFQWIRLYSLYLLIFSKFGPCFLSFRDFESIGVTLFVVFISLEVQ